MRCDLLAWDLWSPRKLIRHGEKGSNTKKKPPHKIEGQLIIVQLPWANVGSLTNDLNVVIYML
jgi:hypothetical protein